MTPSSTVIETIDDPMRYTMAQLVRARRIAEKLGRRRLVLCETPGR
jgi:hypothetical protein